MPIEPRGAGLALGALLLAQGLLVAPIGFTHGVVGATEVFRGGPVRHGVELVLVSGTIVGATFCAWRQGTLAIRWPALWAEG